MTPLARGVTTSFEPTFRESVVQPAVAPGPRCAKHYFDSAVTVCRDCSLELCVACAVSVPKLGVFCRSCALVRAGVRTRRL